jgi:NAD(P)-dependent dehydrogenase (short-subunit alcohol dehydrogenase family)
MATDRAKNIFLTGASTGIGLAIAQHLAAAGHQIWTASRHPKPGTGLHPVPLDLLQPATIRPAFEKALTEAGHFDALINNAGAGVFGPLDQMPVESVRDQFQLMVHGPVELIQLALPHLHRQGHGTIINITSLAAELPIPYMSGYNAAKAALSAITASARIELAGTGVRVIELQPGDINTSFHDSTKRIDGADSERARRVWKSQARTMAAAPPPQRVAEAVARILEMKWPPPVIRVGDFFQARIAPLGQRLLPGRWMEWLVRRYYGL